ncbi:MAG: hypothetical protein A2V67_01900 [Deltaproteobacteria bacterium RBG_13_61_14]|nr:MAG: hypothetical protein A2V67_01900 [Deltaproteobacteria bacterium RBG_13_61_14]
MQSINQRVGVSNIIFDFLATFQFQIFIHKFKCLVTVNFWSIKAAIIEGIGRIIIHINITIHAFCFKNWIHI